MMYCQKRKDISNGLLQGSIFALLLLFKNSINHFDDRNKE